MPRPPSNINQIEALIQIVSDLRGPQGCPWDLEQTHQSLSPYTIEEAYELAEILDQPDLMDNHRLQYKMKDELGDVLFQVILHSQLAQEKNLFKIQDVIQNLNEKLIRRHPHVFTDSGPLDIDQVWQQWESIKKNEKKTEKKKEIFDFPQALPALQRAYKIGIKTEKMKFDWSTAQEVILKVEEELAELKQAISEHTERQKKEPQSSSLEKQHVQEELGDLLFSVAQLARHLDLEPEQALRLANQKFENRFQQVLSLAQTQKLDWDRLETQEKEALWQEVKRTSTQKNE